MTTDQDVGAPYNIQGFPTIKFFGFKKGSPDEYNSGRDESSIVSYAIDKVGSEVRKRGGDKGEEKKKKEKASKSSSGSSSDKDVVVLNQSNFD